MNALELHDLKKSYPGFVLGPLDLTLPGGTVCGLIGENGAGKSTTLKLILNMIERDGGSIRVLGTDDLEASPCTKEEIGVVLSGEGIPTSLTAEQVGRVMAGLYRNWDAAVYADYCRTFELPAAVLSKRVTPYGAEALVKWEGVPAGSALSPVSIEELFVMMVKGEKHA